MSTAEVMTLIVASANDFGSNIKKTRTYFIERKYVKKMLSASQLNRRIHAISNERGMLVFNHLAQVFQRQNSSDEYIIDSFKCRKLLTRESAAKEII